jgi:hypothetical protein
MKRVGDDLSGFSVVFDTEARAVRVRAWGFWNADIAASFANTVAEVCAGGPTGGFLLLDMTGLRPMRDEGQASFGSLLTALPKLGIQRAAVASDNPLTRLQLLRLVAEHGRKNCVEFTNGSADSVNRILTQRQAAQKERKHNDA